MLVNESHVEVWRERRVVLERHIQHWRIEVDLLSFDILRSFRIGPDLIRERESDLSAFISRILWRCDLFSEIGDARTSSSPTPYERRGFVRKHLFIFVIVLNTKGTHTMLLVDWKTGINGVL